MSDLKTAKALDLEEAELKARIDLQVMVPKQTLLALLRIARENSLDPLKEGVALALYDDCHWQAYLPWKGIASYSIIILHLMELLFVNPRKTQMECPAGWSAQFIGKIDLSQLS